MFVVLRRVTIAFVVFAVFWFFAAPTTSVAQIATGLGASLLGAAFFGTVLSWPRQRWVRIAVFIAVAIAFAVPTLREPVDPPYFAPINAAITVLPFFFLAGFVLLVDSLLMFAKRKLVKPETAV